MAGATAAVRGGLQLGLLHETSLLGAPAPAKGTDWLVLVRIVLRQESEIFVVFGKCRVWLVWGLFLDGEISSSDGVFVHGDFRAWLWFCFCLEL